MRGALWSSKSVPAHLQGVMGRCGARAIAWVGEQGNQHTNRDGRPTWSLEDAEEVENEDPPQDRDVELSRCRHKKGRVLTGWKSGCSTVLFEGASARENSWFGRIEVWSAETHG